MPWKELTHWRKLRSRIPAVPDGRFGMTRANDFFSNYVMPAISRWRANDTDLGLAKIAAVNLNQMADYYFCSYPAGDPKLFGLSNVTELRDELRKRYPAFALIHDVADAHKHVSLNRRSRQVTSTDQTNLRSLGYGEAEYGGGRYGSPSEVVVELDSGQKRHFSMLVDESAGMWQALLA
jgi:hypothetical protein